MFGRPSGAALYTPSTSNNKVRRFARTTVQHSTTKKNFGTVQSTKKRSIDDRLNVNLRRASGRGSSLYGRAGNLPKDTRPLSDRNFQHEMRMKLLQFLSESSYPHLSDKMLKQPSKEEFIRILQCVYGYMDEKYVCAIRLEEEVPKLFKDLGYPVTIKSSTMQTISAVHSWPHLLGALTWLIDLIRFGSQLNVARIIYGSEDDFFEDGGSVCCKQLVFSYAVKCFQKYIERTSDDAVQYQDIDCWLETKLQGKEESEDDGGMMHIQDGHDSLFKELQDLKSAPKENVVLKNELERMGKDIPSVQEFLSKANDYQETLNQDVQMCSSERAAVEQEIKRLESEVGRKKNIIASQKISAAEVRQLKFRKEEGERKITQLSSEKQEKRKEQWALETDVSRQRDGIERKHMSFVQKGRTLVGKIEPRGDYWDSFSDLDMSPFNPQFTVFCGQKLKKYARHLVSYCNEQVHITTNEILSLDQTIDQFKDSISSTEEEKEDLVLKAERADKELETYRTHRSKDYQQLKQKIDEMKDKIEAESKSRSKNCEEKQKEHDALNQELNIQKTKQDAEINRMIKELVKVTHLAANHREVVMKMQVETNNRINEEYNSCQLVG